MIWEFEIKPLNDRLSLAGPWRDLEMRSDASFFLSWTWIGTWLETCGLQPLLLSASANGRNVALALLVASTTRRHMIVRSRQLHLHETGDPAIDRITIEHNGFLIDRDAPAETAIRIFRYLRSSTVVEWDECVLGGVPVDFMEAASTARLAVEIDRRSPSFAIDLRALRDTEASMLDRVSRNTRSQIQRACRAAAEHGPLAIQAAENASQALEFFEHLKHLHGERWKHRGAAGAFSEPVQDEFHRKLISRGVPEGRVEILRTSTGDHALGYLYNFVCRRTVYNYQSGFVPQSDNRHRFGLVSHYLASERAKQAGFDVYDLLAGDARYKRSIAQPAQELVWCRVQKSNTALAAERMARRVKRRIFPG
jgi:CelD/BcsL family acetyltransferase involved in cellulose biosynthesis